MKRQWLVPVCLSLVAIGIALAALIRQTVSDRRSGRGAVPAGERAQVHSDLAPCQVTRVTTEPLAFHLASQLGLDAVEFDYTMPAGVQLTAWLETYVGGELDEELCDHFSDSAGSEQRPESHSGSFAFRRYSPKYTSEAASDRCRWEFGPHGIGGVNWVRDPFNDIKMSGSGTDSPRLGLGQTRIVYYHCGQTEQGMTEKGMFGYPITPDEAEAARLIEQMDVCVFIKVRFDKASGPAVRRIGRGLPDFLKQE